MKMKLSSLPGFPLFTPEPSSLISSSDLLQRKSASSSASDRGSLQIMKFADTWQHSNCSVMRWYKQQTSSTCFQSVEHCRTLNGPFFHEFLLLRLTDGSVCRVERTGDGSRADAIRWTGCTANDLIQWFSAEDYGVFAQKVPSALIATIDLGQEFDILDVLAVCYSIHNTDSCRVYTLQRYNCYFFCWTILSVLTRRMVNWETTIQNDMWDMSLNAVLDDVSNLSPEEERKHLVLRICTLLDPHNPSPPGINDELRQRLVSPFDSENPRPARFIHDELRQRLMSQSDALIRFNKSLGDALWQTDWELAFRSGLASSVEVAAAAFLARVNPFAAVVGPTVQTSKGKMGLVIDAPDRDLILETFSTACVMEMPLQFDTFTTTWSRQFQMLTLERPLSFGTGAMCSATSHLRGIAVGVDPGRAGQMINIFPAVGSSLRSRLSLMKMTRTINLAILLDHSEGGNTFRGLLQEAFDSLWAEILPRAMSASFDTLEAKGKLNVAAVLVILNEGGKAVDLSAGLGSLLTEMLEPSLRDMLQAPQPTHLQIMLDGFLSKTENVIQLQKEYICKRVLDHADRVAAHQLGAAPLVRKDIQKTMTEVWKTMPPGFGSRAVET